MIIEKRQHSLQATTLFLLKTHYIKNVNFSRTKKTKLQRL